MRVLILGGGGTLGAFSAGALCALEEKGFVPDAMIGSSAGGINMLRWLVDGPAEAVRFWKDTASVRMLVRGLLHGKNLTAGLLDPEWFRARVEAGVDFERMLGDRRPLAFLVVDLATGAVKVRGNRTERTAEGLRLVSEGAYALPPLLPPVQLDGQLLADGGLLYNAPLSAACKLGATEIVYLCNVHALPRHGFERRSTVPATWRYAEIFFRRASNVGFADAEIRDGRYRGVPFLAVAPPADLRFGSLIRWMVPRVDAVQHLVDAGYRSASEAFAHWSPDAAGPPSSVHVNP